MRRSKRIVSLLLSMTLLCATGVTVFAHEAPDLEKDGSVRITMRCGDTNVGGGSLTLYRAGDVKEDDGNYSFALTAAFAGSGASLAEVSSPALGKTFAGYAKEQNISGETKKIDKNGSVSFENLKPGLYLLVQTEAAEGYNPVTPFLVSVPMQEDGSYVYNVDASPKVELEKEPAKPVTPSKPDPSLPQTGQLNWPIPVLVIAGLLLFSFGWALRFRKRSTGYEG